MPELSNDEKIKLLSITRGLLAEDSCACVISSDRLRSDVKEMYCLLRDLVLDKEGSAMAGNFCYAVAKHEDGTVDLTVFEEGNGATIELDQSSLKQLIKELAGSVSRIPKQYKKSNWRGTLPVDTATNEIGVSFDLYDGQTIRLRLGCEGANHLSESIQEYLNKEDHYARHPNAQ